MDEWENTSSRWCYCFGSCSTGDVRQSGFGLHSCANKGTYILSVRHPLLPRGCCASLAGLNPQWNLAAICFVWALSNNYFKSVFVLSFTAECVQRLLLVSERPVVPRQGGGDCAGGQRHQPFRAGLGGMKHSIRSG